MSGDKNMEICWRESGGGLSIGCLSVPWAVYAFSVLFAQHPLQWNKRQTPSVRVSGTRSTCSIWRYYPLRAYYYSTKT
jgi:hypothetical protein